MANQITGTIIQIFPTQNMTSKDGSKTFQRRELLMDCTRFDPYTGERGYENTPIMEFSGDKCAELDRFKVGQVVTISFDLQGSKYTQDGVEKYFTRVRPYKIEGKQIYNPVSAMAQKPEPITNPITAPVEQPKGNDGLPF